MNNVQSVRDMIDNEIKLAKENDNERFVKVKTILMDPFYLAQLMEELGYTEEDYIDNFNAISRYKGFKLGMLNDEGSDIIKFV